jgi:hypothetical protein
VIQDLDDTLGRLLRASLPKDWADKVQISFAAPDGEFPPQSVALPAIDLFLYDVRENLELRSNERFVRRDDQGRAVQQAAPARVDFSYLITAWPSQAVNDPWKDEHRLLGEVMRALLKHRNIPRALLQGELAGQDLPLPVAMLQSGLLQSPGEFWQALGGRPKVSLHYTVTVAVPVLPDVEGPLVLDRNLRMELLQASKETA